MDVLVDILLSLLGRSGDALPFGPLREACEALFRAFAEQVTSEGFADLVRVVQQPPEGQADEEEDEDVYVDDDEDTSAGNHVHESSRGLTYILSGKIRHETFVCVCAHGVSLSVQWLLATARRHQDCPCTLGFAPEAGSACRPGCKPHLWHHLRREAADMLVT